MFRTFKMEQQKAVQFLKVEGIRWLRENDSLPTGPALISDLLCRASKLPPPTPDYVRETYCLLRQDGLFGGSGKKAGAGRKYHLFNVRITDEAETALSLILEWFKRATIPGNIHDALFLAYRLTRPE